MDPALCLKVGLSSKQKADAYYLSRNFGRAFSHYLIALKLQPSWRPDLKEKFNEVLSYWITLLVGDGREVDAVTCYSQAIEVFPENEYAYFSYGMFLLKYDAYGALPAISNFKKCIELDQWNLKALRSLENVLNLAVERWHFRMLNDEIRNRSFWEAILKKVRSDYTDVLDIGTGTGLLSLFAVDSGAKKVFACDSSPIMIKLAKDIIDEHCIAELSIFEKHSTDLKVGEDLSNRVSLVVCEIVDSGLLGEHVLDTLRHAWKHLLKPSGKVLPFAATFYLCGIQSKFLAQKYFFKNNHEKLNLSNFLLVKEDLEYDTEHLELLPGSFKILTDVVSVLNVNFNDLDDIEKVLHGEKDVTISLKAQRTGELSCIVGWFDLQIDEEIVIHTKPGSDVKCWDQAIFCCPTPILVTPEQLLELSVSFLDGKTKIAFPEVLSNNEKVIVSENTISMLNDLEYMNALFATAEQLKLTSDSIAILDISPFPVLGLTLILSRAGRDRLFCVCQKPGEQRLVSWFSESVSAEVEFISNSDICEEVKDQMFDVIYLYAVETAGELSERTLEQLVAIRKLLKPGGVIIPERIDVFGQIVESNWIKRNSQVLNKEVTCNYNIAPFINQYKVDHQLDFRLESCNAIERSDPFKIMEIDLMNQKGECLSSSFSVGITQPGPADAILYWYEVILSTNNKFNTKSSSTHFNMSAVIVDLPVSDKLHLISKYNDGILITKLDF